MTDRPFRRPESYESERVTRRLLPNFLTQRGFRIISDRPERNGQTIVMTTPEGHSLTMRIRLCWRRQSDIQDLSRVWTYSAAQLLAKIKNGDWEGSLRQKIERERSHGITHFLFVQGENSSIVYAALVPLSELLPIWIAQRDISARLIEQAQLDRRRKNHAMNGSSPTLWLQDHRAPQVAAALWNHPGVRDLARIEPMAPLRLPEEVPSGSSYIEGSVQRILVNRYERDPCAREECIRRYGITCFLCGFDFVAVYGDVMAGFTHVHHLNPLSSVGTDYQVDPDRDLRPVCPNCHAVLHRREPAYSLDEVRQFLQRHRS